MFKGVLRHYSVHRTLAVLLAGTMFCPVYRAEAKSYVLEEITQKHHEDNTAFEMMTLGPDNQMQTSHVRWKLSTPLLTPTDSETGLITLKLTNDEDGSLNIVSYNSAVTESAYALKKTGGETLSGATSLHINAEQTGADSVGASLEGEAGQKASFYGLNGNFILGIGDLVNKNTMEVNPFSVGNISANFIQNTITKDEESPYGAVFQNFGTVENFEGDFIGNEALKDYIVLSRGKDNAGKNVASIKQFSGDFIANKAGSGIFKNDGQIGFEGPDGQKQGGFTGDFILNTVSQGSIFENRGEIFNFTGDFIQNTVPNGHLFWNHSGEIGTVEANFVSNRVAGYGSSVFHNEGGTMLTGITAKFYDNKVTGYNVGVFHNNGDFDADASRADTGDMDVDFRGNSVSGRNSYILNNQGYIKSLKASFIGNMVVGHKSNILFNEFRSSIGQMSGLFAYNQADEMIYKSYGDTESVTADFIGNQSEMAIFHNIGTLGFISGKFEKNDGLSVFYTSQGTKIKDSSFLNNQSVKGVELTPENLVLEQKRLVGNSWNIADVEHKTTAEITAEVFWKRAGYYSKEECDRALKENPLIVYQRALDRTLSDEDILALDTLEKAKARYEMEMEGERGAYLRDAYGRFPGVVRAVYAPNDTLEIEADRKDVIFSGNSSKGKANDLSIIVDSTFKEESLPNLKLNAKDGRTISFDGGITGKDYRVAVNDTGNYKGTVRLKDTIMTGAKELVVHNGLFDLTTSKVSVSDSVVFKKGTKLAVALNTDGKSGSIDAGKIVLEEKPDIQLTVSLKAQNIDKFEVLNAKQINGQFNILQNELFDIHYRTEKTPTGTKGVFLVSKKGYDGGWAPDQNNKEEDAWFDPSGYIDGSKGQDVADKLYQAKQENPDLYQQMKEDVLPSKPFILKQIASDTVKNVSTTMRYVLDGVVNEIMGLSSGENDMNKIWVQGGVGQYDYKGDSSFDGDQKYLSFGMDRLIGDYVTLGGGFSYTLNNLETAGRDIDVTGYTGFGYLRYDMTYDFRLDGILSFTRSQYEEKGKIGLNGAEYDVDSIGAEMVGTYDMLYIPETRIASLKAGMRYAFINQDAYKDDAEQKVEADKSHLATAVFGISYAESFGGYNFKIIPTVELYAIYDVLNSDSDSVVTVANGQHYQIQDDEMDKLGFEAVVKADLVSYDGLTFSLAYNGNIRKDYTNHMISLKGKMDF